MNNFKIKFEDNKNGLPVNIDNCCCPRSVPIVCYDLDIGKNYTVFIENTGLYRANIFPKTYNFTAFAQITSIEIARGGVYPLDYTPKAEIIGGDPIKPAQIELITENISAGNRNYAVVSGYKIIDAGIGYKNSNITILVDGKGSDDIQAAVLNPILGNLEKNIVFFVSFGCNEDQKPIPTPFPSSTPTNTKTPTITPTVSISQSSPAVRKLDLGFDITEYISSTGTSIILSNFFDSSIQVVAYEGITGQTIEVPEGYNHAIFINENGVVEQSVIEGDILSFRSEILIGHTTPTPTPTTTNTLTPSHTPAISPSVTSSNTQTPTLTRTPASTTSKTPTATPTPSNSFNNTTSTTLGSDIDVVDFDNGPTIVLSNIFNNDIDQILYSGNTGNNIIVPENYNYAIFIDNAGNVTEQQVEPGQLLTFRSDIVLGNNNTIQASPEETTEPEPESERTYFGDPYSPKVSFSHTYQPSTRNRRMQRIIFAAPPASPDNLFVDYWYTNSINLNPSGIMQNGIVQYTLKATANWYKFTHSGSNITVQDVKDGLVSSEQITAIEMEILQFINSESETNIRSNIDIVYLSEMSQTDGEGSPIFSVAVSVSCNTSFSSIVYSDCSTLLGTYNQPLCETIPSTLVDNGYRTSYARLKMDFPFPSDLSSNSSIGETYLNFGLKTSSAINNIDHTSLGSDQEFMFEGNDIGSALSMLQNTSLDSKTLVERSNPAALNHIWRLDLNNLYKNVVINNKNIENISGETIKDNLNAWPSLSREFNYRSDIPLFGQIQIETSIRDGNIYSTGKRFVINPPSLPEDMVSLNLNLWIADENGDIILSDSKYSNLGSSFLNMDVAHNGILVLLEKYNVEEEKLVDIVVNPTSLIFDEYNIRYTITIAAIPPFKSITQIDDQIYHILGKEIADDSDECLLKRVFSLGYDFIRHSEYDNIAKNTNIGYTPITREKTIKVNSNKGEKIYNQMRVLYHNSSNNMLFVKLLGKSICSPPFRGQNIVYNTQHRYSWYLENVVWNRTIQADTPKKSQTPITNIYTQQETQVLKKNLLQYLYDNNTEYYDSVASLYSANSIEEYRDAIMQDSSIICLNYQIATANVIHSPMMSQRICDDDTPGCVEFIDNIKFFDIIEYI